MTAADSPATAARPLSLSLYFYLFSLIPPLSLFSSLSSVSFYSLNSVLLSILSLSPPPSLSQLWSLLSFLHFSLIIVSLLSINTLSPSLLFLSLNPHLLMKSNLFYCL